MCVSDMPALARFHTTARRRIKALPCSRLRAFGQVCLSPSQCFQVVCIFHFGSLTPFNIQSLSKNCQPHIHVAKRITSTSLWGAAALVSRLYSSTPLMCVHPHKHMLPCIVVLWRTQSTSYPQLSLVTVSQLCGRTGSDRMDCCVIDFNLESAACCFFPPSFHSPDPAGPQPQPTSRGYPWLHCYRKHI